MASITKILPSSIFASASRFTQQPLPVKFTNYFYHLKAHAPALTNRTICIVTGAIALTLFVVYRLTRATGGTEKTQFFLHKEESPVADGKIVHHLRFINETLNDIQDKIKQYENKKISPPSVSAVCAFLETDVVLRLTLLLNDTEVTQKYDRAKLDELSTFINILRELILELKTKTDEVIDRENLKKVLNYLQNACLGLNRLKNYFPFTAS